MKILRKVFLMLALLGVIFFGIFFYLVHAYGKPIVEYQLSRIFHQAVTIQDLRVVPPAGISFSRLDVPEMFSSEQVIVQLGIPDVLKKEWRIAKIRIQKPMIHLSRKESGEINFAQALPQDSTVAVKPAPSVSASSKISFGQDWSLKVSRLLIRQGVIDFADNKSSFAIQLRRVDLSARRLVYPGLRGRSNFSAQGEIVSDWIEVTGGRFESQGWVDWPKKDCEAQLVLVDKDKQEVLTANGKSVNNDLVVEGRTKINTMNLGRKKAKDKDDFSLADFLLGAAKTAGIEMDMNFRFKTKLDKVQIDKMSFSGNIGYEAEGKEPFQGLKEKFSLHMGNGTSAP